MGHDKIEYIIRWVQRSKSYQYKGKKDSYSTKTVYTINIRKWRLKDPKLGSKLNARWGPKNRNLIKIRVVFHENGVNKNIRKFR